MGWNLCNCRKEAWKKIRLRRDSNPVPLNTSWTPLPTDRRNHTLGGWEGGREVLGIAQTMVVLQLLTQTIQWAFILSRRHRDKWERAFPVEEETGIVETKHFLTRKSKGIRYGKWRKITKRERLCNSHLRLKKKCTAGNHAKILSRLND